MVREGEITRRRLRREWPHHIALSAETVRGTQNSAATSGFAKEFGAAPHPLSDFHDDRHFTVFHFRTVDDAKTFAMWFRSRVLPARRAAPAAVAHLHDMPLEEYLELCSKNGWQPQLPRNPLNN